MFNDDEVPGKKTNTEDQMSHKKSHAQRIEGAMRAAEYASALLMHYADKSVSQPYEVRERTINIMSCARQYAAAMRRLARLAA